MVVPMFLRAKQVKGHCYYYICKTSRENGKVTQKVQNYLGNYVTAKRTLSLQFRDSPLFGQLVNRLEQLHKMSLTS